MDAVLIGKLDIDTYGFLASAKEIMGQNLSTMLDKFGRSPHNVAGFLASMLAMKDSSLSPDRALDGPLLPHAFYVFLFAADDDILKTIRESTRLSIWSNGENPTLAVVSGDLLAWRDAVIYFCQHVHGVAFRTLFNKVYSYLDKEGLSKIWHDFKKKQLPDKSFTFVR